MSSEPFSALPIPDLDVLEFGELDILPSDGDDVEVLPRVVLRPGESFEIEYASEPDTLFLAELIELPEPGTLTVTHVSGKPLDSFGELFERDASGALDSIVSNDDGGEGLNTSLTVPLVRGGYCYLLRHLSGFPIQAGGTDGGGDEITIVRFAFAP